ncbi:hypothetical protein VNI00_014618 [Paramarasmius palmivorus]|uniref:SHSP domain-containing protein n=1 Tax=Paramarasmius palmivorus TaxID=297713 RepID=A0AAW0BVG8_9AGAR
MFDTINDSALVSLERPLSPAQHRAFLELAHNIARRLVKQQQADMAAKRAKVIGGRDTWIPRVDIFDDPDSSDIVSVFEVPGASREDVKVNVIDGKLIVEGQRAMRYRHCTQESSEWVHSDSDSVSQVPRSTAELRYGKFRRELVLPEGVTSAHVRVLLEHGTLHVQWPRSVHTQSTGTKRRRTEALDEFSSTKKIRKE